MARFLRFQEVCSQIGEWLQRQVLNAVGLLAMVLSIFFAVFGMEAKGIETRDAMILAAVIEGAKVGLIFWFWQHINNVNVKHYQRAIVAIMLLACAYQSWNYAQTYLSASYSKGQEELANANSDIKGITEDRAQAQKDLDAANERLNNLPQCSVVTTKDNETRSDCRARDKAMAAAQKDKAEATAKLKELRTQEKSTSEEKNAKELKFNDPVIFKIIAAFMELAAFLSWWCVRTAPMTSEQTREEEEKKLAKAVEAKLAADAVRFEGFITVNKGLQAAAETAASKVVALEGEIAKKVLEAKAAAEASEKASRAAQAALRIRSLGASEEIVKKEDVLGMGVKSLEQDSRIKLS